MATLVILLLLILALGALSLSGHTADSRDSEYGLGHLLATANTPANGPAADAEPVHGEPADATVPKVPAAWLPLPLGASGVEPPR
jgi:hypothetical protein